MVVEFGIPVAPYGSGVWDPSCSLWWWSLGSQWLLMVVEFGIPVAPYGSGVWDPSGSLW